MYKWETSDRYHNFNRWWTRSNLKLGSINVSNNQIPPETDHVSHECSEQVESYPELRNTMGGSHTRCFHSCCKHNNSTKLTAPPSHKRDTTETPPKNHHTSPRHHQGTTETPSKYHRETTETPGHTPPRPAAGSPTAITTPSYRYWGIKTIGKHGKLMKTQ